MDGVIADPIKLIFVLSPANFCALILTTSFALAQQTLLFFDLYMTIKPKKNGPSHFAALRKAINGHVLLLIDFALILHCLTLLIYTLLVIIVFLGDLCFSEDRLKDIGASDQDIGLDDSAFTDGKQICVI